jgi:hypothetical protein
MAEPVERLDWEVVVGYAKQCAAFYLATSCYGAKSEWSTYLNPDLRELITDMAAPYILVAKQYLLREKMLSCQHGILTNACLQYNPMLRNEALWWGQRDGCEFDLDANGAASKIFAGGLVHFCDDEAVHQHESALFRRDENNQPEWIVLAIELRGMRALFLDIMVHVDATMRDILVFVCQLFQMPVCKDAQLVCWGFDAACTIDVHSYDSAVYLHMEDGSALLHSTIGKVYAVMEQVKAQIDIRMEEEDSSDDEGSEVGDFPCEARAYRDKQLTVLY